MTAMTAWSQEPVRSEAGERAGHREAIEAFQDVARAAAVPSVKLEDLLRLTGEHLCRLIGVSRSSVYLRRSDGRFQGQVAFSTSRPNIDSTASKRVTGRDRFTADIVSSAGPVAVADASQDARTVQRAMRLWQVKDVVGVPLVVDGEVIGIIYADDAGRQHTFSPADLEVAQTFSSLAAYVIRQAWQRKQADSRAAAAEQEQRALERAAAVRQAVTASLSSGATLTGVLQVVADMVGKPVVRYGRDLNALAWASPAGMPGRWAESSPALTAADLLHADVAHAVARFRAGASHVVLRTTPERRCRRILVRLAGHGVERGYLELCEMGGAFRPSDRQVLVEAAAAILLKFSVESMAGSSAGDTEEFLTDLLRGRHDESTLRTRAPEAGVDPDRRHVVVRLARSRDHDQDGMDDRTDLLDELSALVQPQLRSVGTMADHEELVALFELDATLSRSEVRTVLTEAWAALSPVDRELRAVVSDMTARLCDLGAADQRVAEVTELIDQHPSPGDVIVFAEDFELVRLASGGGGARGAAQAAAHVLRPLIQYDRDHGGSLLSTLGAFIDCGAQYRVTAGVLGVHENTVRYRLNRVAEIAEIDPCNFHDLSRAAFALQVERLRGRDGAGRAADRTTTSAVSSTGP